MSEEPVIAAIATPSGEGGVGMIRVSGPGVRPLLADNLDRDPTDLEPRRVTLCEFRLRHEQDPLDEGLVTFFEAPRSYTGEDVLELTGHGSPLLLQKLLADIIDQPGIRLAEPGEFTRRAYQNEKLDLAQADAVASLISARSEAALRSSARQLKGELSEVVEELRESLIHCRSRIEAGLDFSDEDSVGDIPYEDLNERLREVRDRVDELIQEGERGTLLQQGCKTAIVGRPNVGKSSLLNRLLDRDRAIVTPQPGTTRDVVSDQVELGGIPFELHDTAGIRDNPETIEAEGVRRSKVTLGEADLVLFLVDGSEPLTAEDRRIHDLLDPDSSLLVVNKLDRDQKISDANLRSELGREPDRRISALTGENLEDLVEDMVRRITGGEVRVENPLVTKTRHVDALKRTRDHLERSLEGLREGRDPTLLAEDLGSAAEAASTITGEITTEDLLDRIFSDFCIGK